MANDSVGGTTERTAAFRRRILAHRSRVRVGNCCSACSLNRLQHIQTAGAGRRPDNLDATPMEVAPPRGRQALKLLALAAENSGMDITNSTSVTAATLAAQSDTADAANMLVLKKAMSVQAAGALALIDAIPQQPPLATEGTLGRNVNAFA